MGPSLIFSKRLTHDVGSRCGKIFQRVTPDLGSKLLKFSKRSVYDQDGSKKRKKTLIQDFNFECGHLAVIRTKGEFCMLVNIPYDLKDAHFEIKTSHLKNAPLYPIKVVFDTPH